MSENKYVTVGKISGAFGIKGGIKIYSFTDPRENILNYSPWLLKNGNECNTLKVISGNLQGRSIIVQLDGVTDRDQAEALLGWDVVVLKDQLPATKAGEFYWSDLIGLYVETLHGVKLGIVISLLETGANDVLIVQGDRERAIPFIQSQVILEIDLQQGKMIVDWDPEF